MGNCAYTTLVTKRYYITVMICRGKPTIQFVTSISRPYCI